MILCWRECYNNTMIFAIRSYLRGVTCSRAGRLEARLFENAVFDCTMGAERDKVKCA